MSRLMLRSLLNQLQPIMEMPLCHFQKTTWKSKMMV